MDTEINNELTQLDTEVLIKICRDKVKEVRAYDPTTALVIFVYDSEKIHYLFQLCAFQNKADGALLWRPFINNALGQVIAKDEDLIDFVGNYVIVEIEDLNLNDKLRDLVSKNQISQDTYKKIEETANPNSNNSMLTDPGLIKETAKQTMDPEAYRNLEKNLNEDDLHRFANGESMSSGRRTSSGIYLP